MLLSGVAGEVLQSQLSKRLENTLNVVKLLKPGTAGQKGVIQYENAYQYPTQMVQAYC